MTFNMLTGKLPFPGESMQETMIMRLTDDPHPLSAMKPDVSWPADLQAVMDKVLARKADDRYRNASEYAHDLVQAIDRMPVTSITSMGTEVLNRISQGSAKQSAAAATAATVQVNVPKTRVATKDDAAPIARPAAPSPAATPTKSKTGMYAGVGGLLLAAGIGAFLFLKPGGSKPDGNSTNSTGQPTVTQQSPDSTKGNPPAAVPNSPAPQQFNAPLVNIPDSLDQYFTVLEAGDDSAAARRVLGRLAELKITKTDDRVQAARVRFKAKLALNDMDGACAEVRDADKLQASAPVKEKLRGDLNLCK